MRSKALWLTPRTKWTVLRGTLASRRSRAEACTPGPRAAVKMGCRCWGVTNFWQDLLPQRYRGRPLRENATVAHCTGGALPIRQKAVGDEEVHHVSLTSCKQIFEISAPGVLFYPHDDVPVANVGDGLPGLGARNLGGWLRRQVVLQDETLFALVRRGE